MLKQGQLAGNPHLQTPNPYLRLEATPFYLVKNTCAWPKPYDEQGGLLPRRAGVSGFGVGGSNAHVIIDEWLESDVVVNTDVPVLIVLSAKTQSALLLQAQLLADYLTEHSVELPALAYTLYTGRDAMAQRLSLIVSSQQELIAKLHQLSAGQLPDACWRGSVSDDNTVLASPQKTLRCVSTGMGKRGGD
ncbi:KS-MAT linker domain-containing protein [Methylocucumis oryzae]|nr:ketoacyl-synthetase C-terminal extension domain-containing protein [Methylocucumis oryzae]